MNTPLMTAKHMDTAEELFESMQQFVRRGKVVNIEEQRILRLAERVMDEAVMLDLTFRLGDCAHKENGVFGQRFQQLFREAEAFRAQMLERQNEIAA